MFWVFLRPFVILVTVLFFKKAGKMGGGHTFRGGTGVLPALVSLGLWVLALYVLRWGFGFGLLLQAAHDHPLDRGVDLLRDG